MREIVVFDTSDLPCCADCKFVMVQKEYGQAIAFGCTKIFHSGRRDIFTGETSETNHPIIAVARVSERLCGMDGRWFEHKDGP